MMDFLVSDFNGADQYFAGRGRARWAEIEEVLVTLRPQLQPSGQAGKVGVPIFDPKATNANLTAHAASLGWRHVPVPGSLRSFGKDWDGGKGAVLAEWQFSNYPFLWNNIIRSEAVYQSGISLPPLTDQTEALIIVTKSGAFPASNSTLYLEQAHAQIETVTTLGVFQIPIRLIGLTVDSRTTRVRVDWNEYGARYGREIAMTSEQEFRIRWGGQGQYGNRTMTFL